MHRIVRAGAIAVAVLTLAACGVQTGTATSGGAATPADGAPPAASASQPPGFAKFGASVKYDDGLVVSTSKAARFKPAQYAYGLKPGHVAVKVVVTVTNGTKAVWDSTLLGATMTYGDAGESADTITDVDHKVDCNAQRKVAPGSKVTITCGFSVPPAGARKLQAQVNLGDFTHDAAVFTGAA
jgi:hypothetical protein